MAREYKLRPQQVEVVHNALGRWADHESEEYADWQVQELVCGASEITIFINECENGHLLIGNNAIFEEGGPFCRACRILKEKEGL